MSELGGRRARVVFLVRLPEERTAAFLAAYEAVRHLVAGGVPGHLVDQVCRSATDPEQWLITSEWASLADFEAWERSPEHRDLVRPMRECFTDARSLRFHIHAETPTPTAPQTPTPTAPQTPTPTAPPATVPTPTSAPA